MYIYYSHLAVIIRSAVAINPIIGTTTPSHHPSEETLCPTRTTTSTVHTYNNNLYIYILVRFPCLASGPACRLGGAYLWHRTLLEVYIYNIHAILHHRGTDKLQKWYIARDSPKGYSRYVVFVVYHIFKLFSFFQEN